ncbi:MAG: amidohydrolase family protein [Chloroflexi bacterium]|nr:amidohydrolase family protein [Chloroflexota bacterium]
MAYDLVIKNGTIVDGSGLARFKGDVAISNGRIAAIGRIRDTAREVIDADGLVVSPGIVDTHTHYDAQLLWDPLATCSCWHGVTTVVTGNCGYTLAPCKPPDRDYMSRTFAKVEGVSLPALEKGLPWGWTTFPEYLEILDKRLGVNVVPYIGHTAVRRYVLGEAANQRAATADETRRMKQIVAEAMEAGAGGFTTSLSPTQVGWYQEPIPSALSNYDEIVELASAVGESGVGTVGILPRTLLQGVTPAERQEIVRVGLAARRPLVLQVAGRVLDEAAREGLAAYTLINGRPFDRVFNLKKTSMLDGMPNWRGLFAVAKAEQLRLMRDPATRAALRDDIDHPNTDPKKGQILPPLPWHSVFVHRVVRDEHKALVGLSLKQLAERQSKHIADAMLDLALDEHLETHFRYLTPWSPEREAELARQIRSPYALLGTSDGGAHLDRDDGSEYSTFFIRYWVTDKAIFSLEEAIRLLTFYPASIIGLWDRGLLRPGYAADVMVFDPAAMRIAVKDVVGDLPGGETRFGALPEGIKYTIVNGQVLTRNGREHTGAFPGRVLRLRHNVVPSAR